MKLGTVVLWDILILPIKALLKSPLYKQAHKPRSYASLKLRPSSDSLTYLLTHKGKV